MFSPPNLNCIIGGRGTGKSTIIEAIRLALGKEKEPKIGSETKEKIERIKEALKKRIQIPPSKYIGLVRMGGLKIL